MHHNKYGVVEYTKYAWDKHFSSSIKISERMAALKEKVLTGSIDLKKKIQYQLPTIISLNVFNAHKAWIQFEVFQKKIYWNFWVK